MRINRTLGWVAVIFAAAPLAPASAQLLLRYERRPVPPADIPNVAPGRGYPGYGRYNIYGRRFLPPLPRTRPSDLTTGVAKEISPPSHSNAREAIVPDRSDVALPPTSRPAAPTMVPVAPLE